MASGHLFCPLEVTPLSVSDQTLASDNPLDSLGICLSSQCHDEPKTKAQLCTWSTSQPRGHQPKQTGSKFANLFSFDELQKVFHSRLKWLNRLVNGKELHNSNEAKAS